MSKTTLEQDNSLPWGSHFSYPEVKDDSTILQFKYRLLVLVTVITGLLMWTYSVISMFLIDVPLLARIGVTCSIIHAFSPLAYRLTKSMKVAAYLMVTAGMTFQFAFSFFTGGFFSMTLIWFAILPMIVGLLTNKSHTAIWTFLSASAYVSMFWLHRERLIPESAMNDLGQTISQFLIGLGLIGLVGGFSIFFLELSYFYHRKTNTNLIP